MRFWWSFGLVLRKNGGRFAPSCNIFEKLRGLSLQKPNLWDFDPIAAITKTQTLKESALHAGHISECSSCNDTEALRYESQNVLWVIMKSLTMEIQLVCLLSHCPLWKLTALIRVFSFRSIEAHFWNIGWSAASISKKRGLCRWSKNFFHTLRPLCLFFLSYQHSPICVKTYSSDMLPFFKVCLKRLAPICFTYHVDWWQKRRSDFRVGCR